VAGGGANSYQVGKYC